jgi:4,5-DOPA dioxygenase extradiol
MPSLFVGHGGPIHVLERNDFTKMLQKFGRSIQKPKAVLIVSAHWVVPYNAVSMHDTDHLMYDMYGFPQALYEISYPAPNAEYLIAELKSMIPDMKVETRGLDHGVWSVLYHMFPEADIPVIQLGINSELSMQEHFEMGKKLRVLRDEGVLIIGSGNITHNLSKIGGNNAWAVEFDHFVANAIEKQDYQALIEFETQQRYAKLAHPTTEHYVPLLYVAGSSYPEDVSSFIYEEMWYGSLSMRTWLIEA